MWKSVKKKTSVKNKERTEIRIAYIRHDTQIKLVLHVIRFVVWFVLFDSIKLYTHFQLFGNKAVELFQLYVVEWKFQLTFHVIPFIFSKYKSFFYHLFFLCSGLPNNTKYPHVMMTLTGGWYWDLWEHVGANNLQDIVYKCEVTLAWEAQNEWMDACVSCMRWCVCVCWWWIRVHVDKMTAVHHWCLKWKDNL